MSIDFKAGLKKAGTRPGPEPKAAAAPEKVDFRAMLGKKGGGAAAPKPGPGAGAGASPASGGASDFRSMLKKPGGAGAGPAPGPAGLKPVSKDKQNGINGVEKSAPTPDKKAPPEKKTSIGDKKAPAAAEPKKEEKVVVEKKAPAAAAAAGGKQPSFGKAPSDVTVAEGQRLHLQCEVTSDPAATVTWALDNKVIKASKFIVLAQDGGKCSLTIDKTLPEDAGRYTCKAENAAGKAECSCKVIVSEPTDAATGDKKSAPTTENEALIKKKQAPKSPTKQGSGPQVTQFPSDQTILAGKKVDLLCNFTGAAPITCTWMRFKKPIQSGNAGITIETTENSSLLTIASSEQDHSGSYHVELQNKFGTKNASLNLSIVDKPDPPARVPAASDIRESSLTLSWYGPTYDGGSIVKSYNLEIWNSVDKKWTELASCNSTSYSVQKLQQDREYKFRVRAVNMYGVGEPSAESVAVTVGAQQVKETKGEEVEAPDDNDEKEQEYRDVVVKNCSVKDYYDVEDRLGTGKFGQVFKLVEKSTKKVWAGKFIKAFSAKEKDNVRQEIDIMNSLHHPKLVQCMDAFEGQKDIVMVLEMISGGELFDRIVDEDFELSEREVIKYMLQIIDGVAFIHKQGIVHLDLKPENIMCINKTGSKIKLIDFGLARRLENSGGLKVLFGTPEFVAPEVINYEEIGYATDMWSIGVICYILVSGLSPFMGDNDNETLANVTSATWDFEDDSFEEISEEAKDFISSLLKKAMKARLTCVQCLDHKWLKQDTAKMEAKQLSKEALKKYILRRKWQKTGNAVRAISRFHSMGMLGGGAGPKKSPTDEDAPSPFLESLEDESRTPAAPTFITVIRDVEVVEGSAARFDCKIEGYPDPDVVWYKDEQPIKETRHFQIDYDEDGHCALVISEVCPDDDAKYTCKAVNREGEASCTAELMVEFMNEEGEEGEEEGGEEEEEEEEEEE
ncbi:myosin light chain kinase, smooth muscle [Engraulis encrasicolus]|uniref:myosin light chain kinase, smooth muscle n=1 Tax=Engraulis encrasicolus TaxID=184585 RepID=UPI002FD38C0C